MNADAYLQRLSAALGSVVTSGPPIPRRDFAAPKTTINYSEVEVAGIVKRVLEGVRNKASVPLTLLSVMGASKQGDSTGALWYDICASVFDVSSVVVREVEITVVVPYKGSLHVTKCRLTTRNTASWGLPDPRDTTPLAPFREVGT